VVHVPHPLFRVQSTRVEGLLALNGIVVEAARRHPRGGRQRAVPLRILIERPIRVPLRVHPTWNQNGRAVVQSERLPVPSRETEERAVVVQADHVHAEGLQHIIVDGAEHLERLGHADGPLGQAQPLPQAV